MAKNNKSQESHGFLPLGEKVKKYLSIEKAVFCEGY